MTMTVTDATNHVTTTNIFATQSTLAMTINPVTPKSDLWKSKVNVTGTIYDSTQAVWVNGVKGDNHGDGTWSANDVPTTPGGVAIFRVDAYEANEQQPDGSYGNP